MARFHPQRSMVEDDSVDAAAAGRRPFSRAELGLVATAAALVFTRVFGFSLVLPNFRSHFEGTLGYDALLVGVAFGAAGLTLAAMQLPMGLLSDKWGRRPVLLAATMLFVLGSVWAAVADSIGALIAARLVQGLGAVGSTAMAAVGESIPSDRRTFAMAMVGIPAGGGFLLGMILGPILFPIVGMGGLFWVTAALALGAGLPVLGVRFAAPAQRPPIPTGNRSPVFGLAFAGFTANFALMTVLFFLPSSAAWDLVPLLLVAMVLQLLFTRAIDKMRLTWQPIAAAALVLALTAAAYALSGSAWIAAVAGAWFFTSHAVLMASLPSQVSRLSGPAGGQGHGVQNIATYLGTFLGGTTAGALAASPAAAFVVVGMLALVASALVTRGLRRDLPLGVPA